MGVSDSLEEWDFYCVWSEVVVDVGGQQSPVPVISHVTTVVHSCNKVLQSVPGGVVLVLVQVDAQQVLRHLKLRRRY